MEHFWISACPILHGVLVCIGEFCEYIGIGVVLLLLIWRFTKIPSYMFRKLLHLVAFTSLIEMMLTTDRWYIASLTALLFAAAVYPILCRCEKYPWYDGLFVQKEKGEIKKSLVLLFTMIAVVIAFTWGLLGERYAAVTATWMWGAGDAAAAVIGIRFGRHIVRCRLADGKKTWEGSCAMFLTAFLIGTVSMLLKSSLPWMVCLEIVFPAALTGTAVELISKHGNDTVTVPVAISLVVCLLSSLLP